MLLLLMHLHRRYPHSRREGLHKIVLLRRRTKSPSQHVFLGSAAVDDRTKSRVTGAHLAKSLSSKNMTGNDMKQPTRSDASCFHAIFVAQGTSLTKTSFTTTRHVTIVRLASVTSTTSQPSKNVILAPAGVVDSVRTSVLTGRSVATTSHNISRTEAP